MQKQRQKTIVSSWDEMADDMLAAIRFCPQEDRARKLRGSHARHLALIGD